LKVVPKNKKIYKGIIDCLVTIVRYEGVRHLWRGNGINVTRYFPMSAINFAFKEKFSEYLVPNEKDASEKRILAGNLLSGGLSGMISLFSVYPLDYARTRLSVDCLNNSENKRQFRGLWDCVFKTYRVDGIRGCYKGVQSAMLGVFTFRALWFGGYDYLKRRYINEKAKHERYARFCIATAVTVTAGYICYPLDTISRKLQV